MPGRRGNHRGGRAGRRTRTIRATEHAMVTGRMLVLRQDPRPVVQNPLYPLTLVYESQATARAITIGDVLKSITQRFRMSGTSDLWVNVLSVKTYTNAAGDTAALAVSPVIGYRGERQFYDVGTPSAAGRVGYLWSRADWDTLYGTEAAEFRVCKYAANSKAYLSVRWRLSTNDSALSIPGEEPSTFPEEGFATTSWAEELDSDVEEVIRGLPKVLNLSC